jgi:hypothetical protein
LVTLVVHGYALLRSLNLDLLLGLLDLIQYHPAGITSIPLIFLFLVYFPNLVHIFHLVVQHIVKVGLTPKLLSNLNEPTSVRIPGVSSCFPWPSQGFSGDSETPSDPPNKNPRVLGP